MEHPQDDSSPIARDLQGGRSPLWDVVPCGSKEARESKKRKKGVENDGSVIVPPEHFVVGSGSSTSSFGGPPGGDWVPPPSSCHGGGSGYRPKTGPINKTTGTQVTLEHIHNC